MLNLRFILPLCVLLVFFGFLWQGLRTSTPSAPTFMGLLHQEVPNFQGTTLEETPRWIDQDIFTNGRVTVLNVWASWCRSCAREHPSLFYLQTQLQKKQLPINLIGLNYRDQSAAAMAWLSEQGNPYTLSLQDPGGRLGVHFGIYGTPETFVIDTRGVIRERYSGALTTDIIDQHVLPLVESLMEKT